MSPRGIKPYRARLKASPAKRSSETQSPADNEHNLYSSLAESANIFYFSYDPKLKLLVKKSDNALAVLGARESDIHREANLFLRYVHPRDRFLILSKLEDALSGLAPYQVTYRWVRPDTKEIRLLHCRAAIKTIKDRPIFEGMIFELSQIQEHTSELIHTLKSLENTFVILDSDLNVIYHNDRAQTSGFTFGDPEFAYNKFHAGAPLEAAFSSKEQWEKIRAETSQSFQLEKKTWDLLSCNSRSFQVESSLFVDSANEPIIVLHIQDVSELINARIGLQNLSKATSYQVVAHGVMHTINNSLQALITEAANIIEIRDHPDLVRQKSEKLMKLAHRTASLTHELLTIGGEASSLFDLNVCVMNSIARARDVLPQASELEVSFSSSTLCYGNSDHISQQIAEMLRIIWSEIDLHKTSIRTTPSPFGVHQKLVLEVECTVEYQTMEIRQTVEEITSRIQQLSPLISALFDNNRVRFSLALDMAPDSDTPLEVSSAKNPVILIVDDEPMVGETICALLNRDGMAATHVTSARKASQMLRTYRSIEVVITDALMPDIRGADFVRRAKRQFPHIAFIGFSGSPSELKPFKEAGADEVILKPVDPAAMRILLSKYLKSHDDDTIQVGNL